MRKHLMQWGERLVSPEYVQELCAYRIIEKDCPNWRDDPSYHWRAITKAAKRGQKDTLRKATITQP